MASAFFNGLHAFLQFKNFRVKHAITLQQTLVFGVLVGNLLCQVGHLRQAPIAHPKAVLQASQQ